MKIIQKIIALIAVAVIVMRLMVFNAFALPAAPVIASEELAVLLGELLVSAGICTSEQILDMSCEEMKDKLRPIVSSETFPTDHPDAMSNLESSIVNLVTSPAINVTSTLAQEAFIDWLADIDYRYPDIICTPTTDLSGAVSVMECRFDDGHRVIYYSNSPGTYNPSNGSCVMNTDSLFREVSYDKKGNCIKDKILDPPSNVQFGYLKGRHGTRCTYIYGNWLLYGSEAVAETDDEEIPIIGEAAGTAVTPDMLNPDGSVTIDGTTYYPQDYIDWDKFKDTAIIDLLNDILARLDNAYIVEQDKDTAQDIVGDVSVDLDIGELNNFQVPLGIADVFPFCLPFDFYKGLKLFAAKPETPYFECEINIPSFLNVPVQSWKFVLDFEMLEPIAKITRWLSLISFVIVLIFATGKIVKGGGA